MAQPPAYIPLHSFVSDSATLANFPGQALDVEFQDIKATTDAIRANLALIQRDDGVLANGSVGYDQLSPSLQTNGITPANAWVTGVTFAVGIAVVQNGSLYRALVAHTSGVFATDLAAGKWIFVTSLPTGSFVQAGTGAVTRTVQEKERDIVSVKDFGAVGDGVADDTAAIVAAVTYANSVGGRIVFFPRGTYLVSSSMVFSNFNNITCQGERGATTIRASSGGTFTNGLFTYSGGSHLKHNGITFDVNNKSVGTLIPAIFFASATDIEVSDCEVIHMSTLGIGTSTCNNIRILRNKITLDVAFNSQNNSVLISGNSNDVWIDSNECTRSGILVAATNCWITNNNCHDYKYGAGLGVTGNVVGQSGPYYVIGNTCSGGIGVDTDGVNVAGMEFNGIGGICANNTCFNNAGPGIASFSYGSAITGNVCYNNGTQGNLSHCAGILGAFQSAGQFFANNVVSGNTCYDTGGGTQKFGYQDVGDTRCAGNTFSANNFDHNATSPISMASTNSYQGAVYSGTLAYAGGTVATGTSATFNVTVTNSNLGDFAIGSLDSYAGGASISAKAIGGNVVSVTVSNLTGATATLPAGNFRAMVIQKQS